MTEITRLQAREIFNSRGVPTIEVQVSTDMVSATCGVPSGASTGSAEAQELRDGTDRFAGLGVRKAVRSVTESIAPNVVGMAVGDQLAIDKTMIELDGTENKHQLGSNAILGVSIAAAKAAAKERSTTLASYLRSQYDIEPPQEAFPRILANLINGGEHATGSKQAFQEFMVIPQATNPHEAAAVVFSVQRALKNTLTDRYGGYGIGDEGGYTLPVGDAQEALSLLKEAVDRQKFEVTLGIDVAANSFFADGKYQLEGCSKSAEELADHISQLADRFPLSYIEDPFVEDDFSSYQILKGMVDPTVVGDDLTVTNPERISRAAEEGSIDGVIIKPNQIGTLTETCRAVKTARKHELVCFASHRSGETNDSFIADLAVGLGCAGVKIGALQRGERVAKYNQLLNLYGKR